MISQQGPDSTADDLHPLHLMIAGGMSGIGAWLASYPMDYIKVPIFPFGDSKWARSDTVTCYRLIYNRLRTQLIEKIVSCLMGAFLIVGDTWCESKDLLLSGEV